MNTAPIQRSQSGNSPPTLVITPPIVVEPSSSTVISPGGPDFVKSLTTSMTLDRRCHRKKPLPVQPPLGALPRPVSPKGGCVEILKTSSTSSLLLSDDKKSPRVKSAPLTSSEGVKAVVSKKKSSGQSFSKIAILSAFFERKAAQESGAVAPSQPHQRLFPWMGGKDKKYAGLISLLLPTYLPLARSPGWSSRHPPPLLFGHATTIV